MPDPLCGLEGEDTRGQEGVLIAMPTWVVPKVGWPCVAPVRHFRNDRFWRSFTTMALPWNTTLRVLLAPSVLKR